MCLNHEEDRVDHRINSRERKRSSSTSTMGVKLIRKCSPNLIHLLLLLTHSLVFGPQYLQVSSFRTTSHLNSPHPAPVLSKKAFFSLAIRPLFGQRQELWTALIHFISTGPTGKESVQQ